MPEVSRFFGISIIFYYNDHAHPISMRPRKETMPSLTSAPCK